MPTGAARLLGGSERNVDAHATRLIASTATAIPNRETGLSCTDCDRPICTECLRMTPVGPRCPDHATQGKPTHRAPGTPARGDDAFAYIRSRSSRSSRTA